MERDHPSPGARTSPGTKRVAIYARVSTVDQSCEPHHDYERSHEHGAPSRP
jgi:hypothetical protein